MNKQQKLEQAIAVQETLRDTMGDTLVNITIEALKQQLANLKKQNHSSKQQRKQATVLFADISNFTRMFETNDAEDITDMINQIWHRLDKVIVEHGGKIDKHIGDAIMALWGTSETREDDPAQAIKAALSMQNTLSIFRKEQNLQVAMRIGIDTGLVLLGNVGTTGEFTAMGNTVNVASRLENLAPLNGVLISHATYRQVRGIFDVLPQTPLTIKGKTEALQTYVILKSKERAFKIASRGVEGIETPMVGRDDALYTLQQALLKIINVPKTQLITIVGEAGIGKSRLLYEFYNWIDLQPERIFYFKGRTTPSVQSIPYRIIRDMFVYRFGIRESDLLETVLTKFRNGVAPILNSAQADLLGHLIGFDFSKNETVAKLLGNPSFKQLAITYFVKYIQAIATKPTVIFLEDIHWADDSSLELIQYLVAENKHLHLLIVCLARPIFFERYPTWGQTATYTQLTLRPLSLNNSKQLVNKILQKAITVPTELRDLIVQGAGGNPFYVEEFIKILIEDGVILPQDDIWQINNNRISSVRLPPTLISILQARLDSLPTLEKNVLQQASVVGRRFWDVAVAQLSESNKQIVAEQNDELIRSKKKLQKIRTVLKALQNKELIFKQDESTFINADEYIFKHALLRDVSYETLLLKLRRIYHRQVATWLEIHAKGRPEEYLNLIAAHYELAGDVSKATAYLQRSGDEFQRIFAFKDSIKAFERVLYLLPNSNTIERLPILLKLGNAYSRTSNYTLALQLFEEALALAENLNNIEAKASAFNGIGRVLMWQGDYDKAQTYLKNGLSLAQQANNLPQIAFALYNLGDIAYRQGNSINAESYANQALNIYQTLNDQYGIAITLRILGFACLLNTKFTEGIACHQKSVTKFKEIGDPWGVGTGWLNIGETNRRQGHYTEAIPYYEKSLAIFKEIDNRVGISIVILNLGHTYTTLGQNKVALNYFEDALQKALAVGAEAIVLEGLVGIALLQAKQNNPKQAATLIGFVQHHPAYNNEIKQNATPIFPLLQQAFSSKQLESAIAQGKQITLDEVLKQLNI